MDRFAEWKELWSQMGWSQPGFFPYFDDYEPAEDLEEEAEEILEGPLLPLRDMVFFPRMVSPLIVGRPQSIEAVEVALERDEPLIAVAQRDPNLDEVGPEDIYTIGTDIIIGRMLRMPDGTLNILAQGRRRAQILEYIHTEPYIRVRALSITEPTERSRMTEALMRAVLALFERVVQLNRNLPEDLYVFAMNIREPGWLADLIAQSLNIDTAQRQEVLEILDPTARLQRVNILHSYGNWTCWNWRIKSRPRSSRRWTVRSGSTTCGSRCGPSRPNWGKQIRSPRR